MTADPVRPASVARVGQGGGRRLAAGGHAGLCGGRGPGSSAGSAVTSRLNASATRLIGLDRPASTDSAQPTCSVTIRSSPTRVRSKDRPQRERQHPASLRHRGLATDEGSRARQPTASPPTTRGLPEGQGDLRRRRPACTASGTGTPAGPEIASSSRAMPVSMSAAPCPRPAPRPTHPWARSPDPRTRWSSRPRAAR